MVKLTEQIYESYSWTIDWTCPSCQHKHTKPHFAFPKQVDHKKEAGVVGRIRDKFSREGKDDTGSCDDYIKKYGTGPVEDQHGKQNPLFCPHCGWLDDLIHITKYHS